MSADIEIDLIANDLASDTVDRVSARLSNLTDEAEDSSMSMTGTFATAGRVAASSIIAFDRYSIAATAVDNAQTRVMLSQERLTAAQERYGAGSEQARRAQQELEISTKGVEIAQQRLEVRMLMGGLIVFPRMVKGLGDLISQLKALTVAQDVETLSTEANTTAKLANIAVTTLGLGLAIALPALMIAQAATTGPLAPGGGGGGPTSMNFYGDNHFHGVQGPADFAKATSEDNKRISNP